MIMKFANLEEEAKSPTHTYQNMEVNLEDKELLDEELGDSDEESLCTESSWDPDEDDEREVEDVLMNEADLKKRSMMQSEVLKRRRDQEDDIYGREDDRHDIFTRHPHDTQASFMKA
jgi:hypothetical protein